jgi:hypothetical protein
MFCVLQIYIKNNMMSYKIKDNRQNNFTAKIEVTKEDKVKVWFNEPWINYLKLNISEPKLYAMRDYVMSCSTVKNQLLKIISK